MAATDHSVNQGSYCLNCGTQLKGTYCHFCGQKKLSHDHGFFATMAHFIGDFFHFDSLIFGTMLPLIFKPGFLVKEYLLGRRASYLSPIKMYVFLSLIFFSLLFFSDNSEKQLNININGGAPVSLDSLKKMSKQDLEQLKAANELKDLKNEVVVLDEKGFSTYKDYLEYQDSLPKEERNGAFVNYLIEKVLLISEKSGSKENFIHSVSDNFFHNLPKLAFLLLPFAALWLKLLYVRRKTPYLHHLIFIIQWYNLFFLLGTLALILEFIPQAGDVLDVVFPFMLIYLLLAMKSVYDQRWPATILKCMVFLWGLIIMIAFGAVFNSIYSILTIAS